jgi:hypothetical protein
MELADWESLDGGHERLTWARCRWQLSKGITPNAGAAAESLGLNQHTYRAYERAPGTSKHIKLTHTAAQQFGKKFGVSWQWLLAGHGTPFDVPLTAVELHLVNTIREQPEERQAEIIDLVERMLKIGFA